MYFSLQLKGRPRETVRQIISNIQQTKAKQIRRQKFVLFLCIGTTYAKMSTSSVSFLSPPKTILSFFENINFINFGKREEWASEEAKYKLAVNP